MEKLKPFICGAVLSAVIGYSAYRDVSQDNRYLKQKLAEQKTETEEREKRAVEFVYSISKTDNSASSKELKKCIEDYMSYLKEFEH
jgi:hypothetical protein